jgi:hypothetical protein
MFTLSVLSLANPKIAKGKKVILTTIKVFQNTYFQRYKGKKNARCETYPTKNQGDIPLDEDKRRTPKVKGPG